MTKRISQACCALAVILLAGAAQAQTAVDKTPVLHFSFDNVSGSNVVNSGSGGSAMNGTLNGTAAIVASGRFGNALSITGSTASDGSVRVANAVVPFNVVSTNSWTLALWMQTSTAGACYAYQGSGGWDANNTSFYLTEGDDNGYGVNAGAVRYAQDWEVGTAVINDGSWHHVVMTFDGTNKVQYVDGVVDTWKKNNWAIASTDYGSGSQFWIGGNGSANDKSQNLSGLIDEAYVFNLALSAADVQSLFTNNLLPSVPVTVTVSPTNGFIGQVFTVTATAAPAVGTATNAVADLTGVGLASGLKLVKASDNVFTNSFTIPTNASFGADIVKATVIDTEPLAGSGGTTFTVVPRPPTNAIVVSQLSNVTAYVNDEVSFHFVTTNDAPSAGTFPMTYAWYKNSVLVSTNSMGPYFTFLSAPADNSAQIQCIARVANTNYSGISITSTVATLTLNSGTPQYPGLKQEVFSGVTSRADVEIGNVPPAVITVVSNADSSGGFGDNTSRRYSGYFIPPTSDGYVFFLSTDDDSDLFLSTDSTAANKQLIAQEYGWSTQDNWQTNGGNGSLASQKRSDQWTNSVNVAPWVGGISLVAGQKYYFEVIEHNGTGGDSVGVTYETETELTADYTQPANGSPSRLTVASNNIVFSTFPGTSITWSPQPKASATVYEGSSTNFTAIAVSDAELYPNYQWYVNGAPYSGATGTNLVLSTIPSSFNNAKIYLVATLTESGLSSTSSVATLTVQQAVWEAGFCKDERWNKNLSGGTPSVSDIEKGNVSSTPDYQVVMPAWDVGVDNASGDANFVRRVSGYFVPPTTASYDFIIASDDDSDFFISTDNTPANKRLVAQQLGWDGGAWDWASGGGGGATISQQHSDTWIPSGGTVATNANGIALTAGTKYYIEQDFHQGGGGANLSATYKLTTEADPANGTDTRLRTNVIGINAVRCTYVAFTQQPTNATVNAHGSATFNAAGVTDSQLVIGSTSGYEGSFSNKMFFQWYKNGVAIQGANLPTFVLTNAMPSDNNAQIKCQMRALGFATVALVPTWSNSLTATLTVNTGAPPTLVYAGFYTNNAPKAYPFTFNTANLCLDLTFSGPMNPTALSNPNNYTFNAGSGLTAADITVITVNSNTYNEVQLALDKAPTLPCTVTVSGMAGQGGGPALTGSPVANVGIFSALDCIDIGTFDYTVTTTLTGCDPSLPTTMYLSGTNNYTVQCEGSDIFNAKDGFNFIYETRHGNFDVVVRQVDTTHVSNWTKGGLMVRETLDELSRNFNVANDPDSSDGISAADGGGKGANVVECDMRTNSSTASVGRQMYSAAVPPTYPNAWVRLTLQRITNGATVQDIVTAYCSTNGVKWQMLEQTDMATNGTQGPLADPLYIGMASTAHDNDPVGGVSGQYLATIDYADYNSHYVEPKPIVASSLSGTNVVVSWSTLDGALQSSPALTGPLVDWENVTNVGNPVSIPIGSGNLFFRVINTNSVP